MKVEGYRVKKERKRPENESAACCNRLIYHEHLLEDVSSVSRGSVYAHTFTLTESESCYFLFLESCCKGKAALKRCAREGINEKWCGSV